MNFAYPSDKPYLTTKKTLKKTSLSERALVRSSYIRAHNFSVVIDSSTQKCQLVVTEKNTNQKERSH